MGMVGAAFGFGFQPRTSDRRLLGSLLGPMGPGLIAVGLSLSISCPAYFILPRVAGSPSNRVKRPGCWIWVTSVTRSRVRACVPLMAVWALVPLAFAGCTAILPLQAFSVLGWGKRELAILFTLIGVTAANTVQGYFFGRIVRQRRRRSLT